MAVRLALAGGVPFVVVIGLLLAAAVALVLVKKAGGIHLPTPKPEEPRPDAEPWHSDAENPGGPGGSG